MEKKCVAITGASGVLGQALVAALPDCRVRILGRCGENLSRCFPAQNEEDLYAVDYSVAQLRHALTEVDCLVHLAGVRPDAMKKTLSAYQENIRIAEALFQVCAELSIRNVVYASTSAVYSSARNLVPFCERQCVAPSGFYALSKLMVEYLGGLYGLKQKSLRIAPVISPDENPAYMRMAFIHKALKGQDLNICAISHREYIYYKDVVAAIVLALKKTELSGVFNIGSGVSVSNLDYAQSVNQVLAQGALNIRLAADCCEDGEAHVMACDKAQRELGFTASYSLDAAIRDIGENLRARL